MPAGSELGQALMVPVRKTADKAQPPAPYGAPQTGQSPPDHGTGMTQGAERRPGPQSSASPASPRGLVSPLQPPPPCPSLSSNEADDAHLLYSKILFDPTQVQHHHQSPGGNLLIIYSGAMAGSAVLHSTISCVSRLFPIPQGCQPLGTCSPSEKRAGSHLKCRDAQLQHPGTCAWGKVPSAPGMCHQQSLPS